MESESTDGPTDAPAPARVAPETGSHAASAAVERVNALRAKGLFAELSEEAIATAVGRARLSDADALFLDLLGQYYAADGDAEASGRRINQDRYFAFRDGERANAHMVVQRLSALVPEVGMVSLERIGSDDGPLVIRAGELLSAVTDHESDIANDEVDLSEIEEDPRVTIQSLVAAMNVLLERNGVPERLVQLPGDGLREAYVAIGREPALELCASGLLEIEDPAFLRELAGW